MAFPFVLSPFLRFITLCDLEVIMYFPPRLENFQRAFLSVPQGPWVRPFPRLLSVMQNFPGPRIFTHPFGTKVKGLFGFAFSSVSVSVSVSVPESVDNSDLFDKIVSIKVSVSVFWLLSKVIFRFSIGSRFVFAIFPVSVLDSGLFKESINLFAKIYFFSLVKFNKKYLFI